MSSDALEEKEDCSAATETSLPQTSSHVQSTISDSGTVHVCVRYKACCTKMSI